MKRRPREMRTATKIRCSNGERPREKPQMIARFGRGRIGVRARLVRGGKRKAMVSAGAGPGRLRCEGGRCEERKNGRGSHLIAIARVSKLSPSSKEDENDADIDERSSIFIHWACPRERQNYPTMQIIRLRALLVHPLGCLR